MNVIVSNRQKEIIDNANIDAIKDLNGLFNVDDLINKFKNYFFSKMILDATSIVNFASRPVLTTLAEEIGAEKLIILLPSNPEPPMEFKKLLLELKIYNFTTNINDVIKFIDNPNTYEDAVKLLDNSYDNGMYVDNSIKDNDGEEDNKVIPDDNSNNNNNHSSLGDMLSNFSVSDSNTNSNDEPVNNEPEEKTSLVDSIKNSANNNEDVPKETGLYNDLPENNSMEKNTFLFTDGFDDNQYNESANEKKIIGIKNVTLHAGSTSLIYMLHRVIANTLKKNVLSIEIDKHDFRLLRENNMVSIEASEAESVINNAKESVIFVDLNGFNGDGLCTDVLYLVEPSTIMLNKLMAEDKNIFRELKDSKVILNKCLLSKNDIRTLSSEAGMEFFYSVEPLNDRILNESIAELINLLGIK